MESVKKRCWIVLVLLGVTAVMVTLLNLTVKSSARTGKILRLPTDVGPYVGSDMLVDQRVIDILETSNIIMRDYVGPKDVHVAVAIVYYPQYRVYFHMPEGCMAGRGSIVVDKGHERIDVPGWDPPFITANKLLFEQGDRYEIALYFFESGPMITPWYSEMRWHMMKNHVMRRQTGAALVRFSTRTSVDQTDQALALLKEFVGLFVPVLPDYLP